MDTQLKITQHLAEWLLNLPQTVAREIIEAQSAHTSAQAAKHTVYEKKLPTLFARCGDGVNSPVNFAYIFGRFGFVPPQQRRRLYLDN